LANVTKNNATRNRIITFVVVIAIIVVLISALIVGVIQIVHFIFSGITKLDLSPMYYSLRAFGGLFVDLDEHQTGHVSIEKISILLTAVATIALFVATRQLQIATNREVAANAPVLEIDLLFPASELAGETGKVKPYLPSLAQEDESHFSSERLENKNLLYLSVGNAQLEPYAPARDIEINVHLESSDLPESARSPLREGIPIELARGLERPWIRTLKIPVLGANSKELHPIFNVAPLGSFVASVKRVQYYDFRGKRPRSAAYGEMRLNLSNDGNVSKEAGYSEPAKWEMP
jgi:hypothetical protein